MTLPLSGGSVSNKNWNLLRAKNCVIGFHKRRGHCRRTARWFANVDDPQIQSSTAVSRLKQISEKVLIDNTISHY